MWTESHMAELRSSLGSLVFDAYIPLAQDLKSREGGEVLLAYALKYFFTHHRMEKAAAARQDEERKSLNSQHDEHKDRLKERRSERAKPRLEKGGEARSPRGDRRERPAEKAPQAEAPAQGNRLFISLGSEHGLDADRVKAALVELSGAPAEAVRRLELKATCSFAEVEPDKVEAFLAANGKTLNDKTVTVEVARPPSRRRRR